MQEYRKPPLDYGNVQEIGHGGNGQVFPIPGSSSPELVVKIFHVNSSLDREKKEKRYKRFCREIETQKKLESSGQGILPVKDYCFLNKCVNEKPAWFTMPKAKPFFVGINRDPISKMKDMLDLALIIKQVHKMGMAHRDIKPENLLFYQDRICLADFGLIWIDGEESLTDPDERCGPSRIIPPELRAGSDIIRCDYRKSDVYLFAKVLWMYFKRDKYGFHGPYNRKSDEIYLNAEEYGCVSFEPIHRMLVDATRDSWEERPSIAACIDYIQEQIDIMSDNMPLVRQKVMIFSENIALYDEREKPNLKVYDEIDSINNFLNQMVKKISIEFVIRDEEKMTVSPRLFKHLGGKMFMLSQTGINGSAHVYLHIDLIENRSGNLRIYTKKLSHQELDLCTDTEAFILDFECSGAIKPPTI